MKQISLARYRRVIATRNLCHVFMLLVFASNGIAAEDRAKPDLIVSVAFSPNGKILATADGTFQGLGLGGVKLWDVATVEDDQDRQQSISALKQLGATIQRDDDGHVIAVSLQSKKIADDDLRHLTVLRHVEDVNLYETPITDVGLAHVRQMKTLRRLNLGFCRKLTDRGIEQLKPLEKLEFLNLGFCRKITDDGFTTLKHFKQLKTLNLSITSITDDRLKTVAQLKHLENLDLDNTQITDAGLARLANLKKLRYLRLVGTAVTDSGLKQLFGLKRLRFLYVRDTNVTDAGIRQLREALPQCSVK